VCHCVEIRFAVVCRMLAVLFLTVGDIRNITTKMMVKVLILSGENCHPANRFACHHSEDVDNLTVHFYTPIKRTILCLIEIIIEFCDRFVELEFRRNCPHDGKELREVRLPRLNVS
jgi:hypothetical protein